MARISALTWMPLKKPPRVSTDPEVASLPAISSIPMSCHSEQGEESPVPFISLSQTTLSSRELQEFSDSVMPMRPTSAVRARGVPDFSHNFRSKTAG